MVSGESRGLGAATKRWTPAPADFHRLLAWLDSGSNSDGERYLEMRRRLVAYFSRKRCVAPDDLADETLNRVMRRLEEAGAIPGIAPLQAVRREGSPRGGRIGAARLRGVRHPPRRDAAPRRADLGEAARIDAAVASLRAAPRDPKRSDVTEHARALGS